MLKNHSRAASALVAGLILLWSGSVQASSCQPHWHNSITLQDGVITLEKGSDRFQVKSGGLLFYGVHKVRLDEQQQAALADYHRLVSADLPYVLSHSQLIDQEFCERLAIRQLKEHEIQSLIPALRNWQSVSFEN